MKILESNSLEVVKGLHKEIKKVYEERDLATKGMDKKSRKIANKPYNKRIRILRAAVISVIKSFYKVKSEDRKKKEPCPWCNSEYSIIDDDFCQPLHTDFIRFCFFCGKEYNKK